MTLYRQLILVIVTLFISMFIGTLLVNFHSTREFLMEQLASHAQDTGYFIRACRYRRICRLMI